VFYGEAFVKRKPEAYDDIVAQDVLVHDPGVPGLEHKGLDKLKNIARSFWAAFPDIVVDIQYVLGEGNLVVIYYNATGTLTREFQGTQPTGKKFQSPGVEMFRFSKGKIVEIWAVDDTLGMMQQLNLVPAKLSPQ